jgi:hypothetical protein
MQVVRLDDYRPPAPKRAKVQPFHKKYPMPFFTAKKGGGICAWDVTPIGNYTADCETGHAFAIEFLKSCDKTYGWQSLLQQIVAEMICAGTNGAFPNGDPKVNGVIIGFMGVIGKAVAWSRFFEAPL